MDFITIFKAGFGKKNRKGANNFSEKIRGAKTFFRRIFPKTQPKYPVNFDLSLNSFIWGERSILVSCE